MLTRLERHAQDLDEARELIANVDAIRAQRLLLDTTDHASPLLKALSELLRGEVNRLFNLHRELFNKALEDLESRDAWKSLNAEQKSAILTDLRLTAPVPPGVGSDGELAAHLDAHSLASMRAEADAVSSRAREALRKAVQMQEPKARPVSIERATLRTEKDVNDWMARQKKRILDALKKGPVVID